MQSLQKSFINFCLQHNVIQFGEFTLKSGRQSPYFFNAGLFQTGEALKTLGHYYAQVLLRAGLKFDMLFGPAYKGIPLATSTAIAFAAEFQQNIPYCFNRKEAKPHGEGGHLVGAPLAGRVVVIDDVMTAGTAVRQSIELIQSSSATLAGVVILLDRQERGETNESATQELANTYQIPVMSIIGLDDIIDYVQNNPAYESYREAIVDYRQRYGNTR